MAFVSNDSTSMAVLESVIDSWSSLTAQSVMAVAWSVVRPAESTHLLTTESNPVYGGE